MIRRRARASVLVAALIAANCSTPAPADRSPAPPASPTAVAPSPTGEVTVGGMLRHLEALQRIADENGGTRAVGTPGYEASVDYVAETLRADGYAVETPSTEVPTFLQSAPSVLERVEPSPATWVDGRDLRAMLFSASGDVEAPIAAVDGGCSPGDFSGFPDGAVALVEPGPCFRRDQVGNAQAAGATAFIGVTTAETGRPLRPTLITPDGIDVPAIAVTAETGAELADGDVVHVSVSATSGSAQARNIVAALPGAGEEDVVMLGGHLDSVIDGPGIDDNGSGVATLLEVARWIAGSDPGAPVRFAFWAGEEEGLFGSRDYVSGLDAAGLDAVRVYLNLDMVASPNFVTFVYAPGPADPPESERVADLFEQALARAGFESERVDLQGSSDHASFQGAGVATGGLYSGSDEVKTPEQADAYGGTAGEALDPCYHQACDTIENVNRTALLRHALALVSVLAALLAG